MAIPASDFVTVNPAVVGTGGNPLSLNGVIVTSNPLIPSGSVVSFGSQDGVSNYFGASSTELMMAQNYFLGFDDSTVKPGTLFFAPYASTARAAFLRTGSFAGVTLTQLQDLTPGVLIITVDGVEHTSVTINLSAAISFSDAASIMQSAFAGAVNVTWNSVNTTFTFSSNTSGDTSTITFATGTFASAIKATSATSAILSQGQDVDTPSSAMNNVKANTQNWATFTTLFEPVTADKTLFAEWTNSQNQRFMYVAWDTDGQAIVQDSSTCFGALVKAAAYDGVVCVSGNSADAVAQGSTLTVLLQKQAGFVLGTVASINFAQTNGRITAAYKHQAGLLPTVTTKVVKDILIDNGYSFYGSVSTANDGFIFFYNGQMAGRWSWIDPYVDQIYLNSQFQLALMNLLTSIPSIPYNEQGYSLIRSTMLDTINEALNFGSIRTGVTLSSSQKGQVNSAAGRDISQELQQQGYYLQVLDPGSIVRGNRGTPVINFWYTDGGAIQQITMASIDVM
jgi:uncharacterized protein YcgL (UPF0745 family)